jgi:membrane protease YdiL (CAAX protease family)
MSTLDTTVPAVSSQSAVNSWIKHHPIIAMVALMYLLAWPKLIAEATDSYGLTHLHLSPLLDILTGWAPAIAAFTITALVGGKRGVRQLGRKTFRWRVGARWYIVALFGSPALILSGTIVYELLTGQWAALPITQMTDLKAVAMVGVMFLLYAVLNTEEIAWRGFALPRLQSQYGALGACVLLWIPWTLLHLPYFFTKGSMMQQMGFVPFAAGTFTMTLLFAWLFNNTGGSVLLCTLMHAAVNVWAPLVTPTHSMMPSYVGYGINAAIALFLIIQHGAAHLARKPNEAAFLYQSRQ